MEFRNIAIGILVGVLTLGGDALVNLSDPQISDSPTRQVRADNSAIISGRYCFANYETLRCHAPRCLSRKAIVSNADKQEVAVFTLSLLFVPRHMVDPSLAFGPGPVLIARHQNCPPISDGSVDQNVNFLGGATEKIVAHINRFCFSLEMLRDDSADVFEGNFPIQLKGNFGDFDAQYIGRDFYPWALGISSNSVGLFHGLSGASGVFDSFQSSIKRFTNEDHTYDGSPESKGSYDRSSKRGTGGALLGTQILFGICGLLAGFGMFIHTLENVRRLTPDAATLRGGLSALLIGGGGLLAVFGFAGL